MHFTEAVRLWCSSVEANGCFSGERERWGESARKAELEALAQPGASLSPEWVQSLTRAVHSLPAAMPARPRMRTRSLALSLVLLAAGASAQLSTGANGGEGGALTGPVSSPGKFLPASTACLWCEPRAPPAPPRRSEDPAPRLEPNSPRTDQADLGMLHAQSQPATRATPASAGCPTASCASSPLRLCTRADRCARPAVRLDLAARWSQTTGCAAIRQCVETTSHPVSLGRAADLAPCTAFTADDAIQVSIPATRHPRQWTDPVGRTELHGRGHQPLPRRKEGALILVELSEKRRLTSSSLRIPTAARPR